MKNSKLKAAGLILTTAMVLTFAACGSSSSDGAYTANDAKSTEYYDEGDYEAATEESKVADSSESSGTASGGLPDIKEGKESVSAKKIKQDKLIYTCDISIDTLEFEESTKSLAALIKKYDGFIENENYSDGGSYDSYSYYYVEPTAKHDVYTATIRIPSDKYEDFLTGAGDLGDVRSRESHVQNVSQEYTDLKTSLEVYEAAYKRYLDLYEKAKDESYALDLQAKITETQEKIAQLKTRMNRIDTDVAYSFVNIKIREVSKYEAKPVSRDTFGQRMIAEISDSIEGFLDFLEGLLVLVIHLFPFAILAGIIVAIVMAIRKSLMKNPTYAAKLEEKKRQKEARRMAKKGMLPTQNTMTPPDQEKNEDKDK